MNNKKVFCLGFSKTGTTSLENALEILGYQVCKGHYNNNHTNYLLSLYVNKDYKEILKLTRYWEVFADGPWGGGELYKELIKVYPDSKYIITERDPEDWFKSFYNLFTRFDNNPEKALDAFHREGRYGAVYFFKHIFQIDHLKDQEEKIINYYKNYYIRLYNYLDKKNIDYLKINFMKREGWLPLCDYLNKPIPDQSFPHSNKGKYQQRQTPSINFVSEATLFEKFKKWIKF